MTEATTLTKQDTVALWHAVQWMETVLKGWLHDGFKNEEERAQYDVERTRLTAAKRALRKANVMRKSQAQTARSRKSANRRTTAELQADQKTAGDPP